MNGTIAAAALWLDPSGAGESVWTDCVPGRDDLPRTLPEMPSLGITPAEIGMPAPTGGGWLFERTPRPGQGRLTGAETRGLLVVLISPQHDTAEHAQALRDWADFVHISHIAAAGVPGYMMITPYENHGPGPRYLHLYEFDNADAETTFQAMTPLVWKRLDSKDAFGEWANHPELRIDFVSTFSRA
jgi:hypothetical protein